MTSREPAPDDLAAYLDGLTDARRAAIVGFIDAMPPGGWVDDEGRIVSLAPGVDIIRVPAGLPFPDQTVAVVKAITDATTLVRVAAAATAALADMQLSHAARTSPPR